ncbi:unnamed protein product, partial [Mesorhabditis belari]|uniref:Protein kinase domain-containing protein n=1 Tax=Mesorhabditis belari TaxID=2138241 RepID=A0AAF3F9K4_9BILA
MLNNENLLDVSLNDLLNRMIAKNENVTPPNYFSAKECLEHFSLTDANKRYDREFSFDQPKDDKAWRSKNARNKAILWRLLETPTARINFHIEPNGNRQSMPNQRAPIERFKPENYINAFYKSKDESRQDFRIPQGYSQNKTLPNQAHQMHKCLSHPIELQVITHKDYYDTLFAFLYLPCVDIGVNFVGEYNKASPGWKRVACKRYSCEKLDKSLDGYIRLWRELQVCQMTNHKNIAKFYEFFPEWSEQSISHIWLVSERSDMTLKQYYEAVNGKGIDVEKLRIILAQILEALSYLHKKGIMHRAIRPENIGVQENNGRLVLKLFNFGLSREP